MPSTNAWGVLYILSLLFRLFADHVYAIPDHRGTFSIACSSYGSRSGLHPGLGHLYGIRGTNWGHASMYVALDDLVNDSANDS